METSPGPPSQAPYAMVFVEQHISLVRLWLCLCECCAKTPWWKTPTEDCCFLDSARWFSGYHPICMVSWAFPSVPLGLQLAQPCRQKSLMSQCCLGVPWQEMLGARSSMPGSRSAEGGGWGLERPSLPWVEHQRARSLLSTLLCSFSPVPGARFSWVLWRVPSAGSLVLSPCSWFCFLLFCKRELCKASVWSFFVLLWLKWPVSFLA